MSKILQFVCDIFAIHRWSCLVTIVADNNPSPVAMLEIQVIAPTKAHAEHKVEYKLNRLIANMLYSDYRISSTEQIY